MMLYLYEFKINSDIIWEWRTGVPTTTDYTGLVEDSIVIIDQKEINDPPVLVGTGMAEETNKIVVKEDNKHRPIEIKKYIDDILTTVVIYEYTYVRHIGDVLYKEYVYDKDNLLLSKITHKYKKIREHGKTYYIETKIKEI